MQVKLEWNWEQLDNHDGTSTTCRARVIGGWLIHHAFMNPKGQMSESMVFIADRDHQWVIKPPLKDETAAKESLAKNFAPKA